MDLISVIVPVYNVKKYLKKCVDSIINQQYTNLEIILVDDGSTDGSSMLCDNLKKEDERIKVFHKQNGGLSSARNYGFSKSSGKYILFIDSDDYIHEKMIYKLYSALIANCADLAICNYDFVDTNGKIVKQNKNVIKNEIFDKEIAYKKISEKYDFYYITVWNKLYKRGILSNDTFPKGKIHEDEFVIHLILNKCNRIVSINDCLYFYVQRNNSIMHGNWDIKKLDAYFALMNRYYFFIEKGYKDYALYALKSACGILCAILDRVDYIENKKDIDQAVYTVIKYLKFNPRIIKLIIKLYLTKIKNIKKYISLYTRS